MIQCESPIGILTVEADTRVRRVQLDARVDGREPNELERRVATQLTEYFSGARTSFDLPLVTGTTERQARVWAYLDEIPFGEAVSYGRIARELGWEPAAARAVGGAVGANPVLIVRPCHRVLGADGSLTGYAGGLDAKLWLLQHEGILL